MPLLSLLWPLIRLLYRLRVFGRERVPQTGGCLIVCNHVSLIDRVILKAASPRRLRFASNDDPKPIADALDRGEAVLVFPEASP